MDWSGLLRAGLARGLTPDRFWALTPVELTMLLGREAGRGSAMGRARLDELAAAYPDTEEYSNGLGR